MSAYGNEDQIRALIERASVGYHRDAELDAFVAKFEERFGANLAAVVFYGSCLTAKMKKPSSFRDFFILLDDYAPMAKSLADRILLPLMPPNLFFLCLDHDGAKLEAKYHLLTMKQFRRMAAPTAPDHYIIGRMCKRTAIVYSRDAGALESAQAGLRDAFFANARITVPLITEPVDFKGLVMSFLRTSYMSELRLETPEKIEQIYISEKEHYEKLYALLAESLIDTGELTLRDGLYKSSAAGTWPARKSRLYLTGSKVRHVIRFPKMMRNMDNWMEQLLGKYERTFGKKLELTESEKKHKILTAAKYLYKIKIAKKV